MFAKIVSVRCDGDAGHCGSEILTDMFGAPGTKFAATELARADGWAISSAGHFCPIHRQRKQGNQ
jgi:hypothetical protein